MNKTLKWIGAACLANFLLHIPFLLAVSFARDWAAFWKMVLIMCCLGEYICLTIILATKEEDE